MVMDNFIYSVFCVFYLQPKIGSRIVSRRREEQPLNFILVVAALPLVNNQTSIYVWRFLDWMPHFVPYFQDSETEAAYQTFSQTEGESSAAEVNSITFCQNCIVLKQKCDDFAWRGLKSNGSLLRYWHSEVVHQMQLLIWCLNQACVLKIKGKSSGQLRWVSQ